MKPYGVTIQMKPLWHNFCIALFIFFEIEFLPFFYICVARPLLRVKGY